LIFPSTKAMKLSAAMSSRYKEQNSLEIPR